MSDSLPIILGSTSRWRRQLLAEAGVDFTTMDPNIDEKAITADDPETLVLDIASAKNVALHPQLTSPAILITCDQVVTVNDRVYGKPESSDQARAYLRSYNQHPARTYTAVILHNTLTNQKIELVDTADINFHPIPDTAIETAIAEGEIFSCAGAFQVESHLLSQYVASIDGDINSVKGLPVDLVLNMIEEINAS